MSTPDGVRRAFGLQREERERRLLGALKKSWLCVRVSKSSP